jgi:hypothetical protein
VFFRINDPTPVRIAGSGAAVGGLLLLILAGFTGVAALIGVIALCAGVALVDAAGRGELGPRQAGLFLVVLGLGLGFWGFLVVLLLWGLGLPVEGPPLLVLAVCIPASLVGWVLVRPGALRWAAGAVAAVSRWTGQARTRAANERRLGRAAG